MFKMKLFIILISFFFLFGCIGDEQYYFIDQNVTGDSNSGVSQVLAGTNVTVSCTGSDNNGACTVNSTASGGGGSGGFYTAGSNILLNTGDGNSFNFNDNNFTGNSQDWNAAQYFGDLVRFDDFIGSFIDATSSWVYDLRIPNGSGGLHIQARDFPSFIGDPFLIEDVFGTDLFEITSSGVMVVNSVSAPNNNFAHNVLGGFVDYATAKTTLQTVANNVTENVLVLLSSYTGQPSVLFVQYASDGISYASVADINVSWLNPTIGSQTGTISHGIYDSANRYEYLRADTNGTDLNTTIRGNPIILDGNVLMTSPDGTEWNCGVTNGGSFQCT